MQTFERRTVIDAPLDEVWEFHSGTDGLRALTPNWMSLRIEDIEHSDPAADASSPLIAGAEIHASVAPFWVLPRQRFVSVIQSRTVTESECSFVDTMRDGPFPKWAHTHRFIDDGDRTRLVDHVEFEVPGGVLGAFVVRLGLGVFFVYRHWRTSEILGKP